jgi:DNA-binding transcriptional MerR regulator
MTDPVPKKTAPTVEPEWLSAAECASRTGLTVRALRVYERQRLIKPPRSANGWRRYGPVELAKLNTIVILKALGLTLSQIRTVLTDNPPSLLRILDIHAQSWQAKRDVAQRALTLVEAARERLRAEQALTLEELCELVKRLEANRSVDMKDAAAVTRELINQTITPEEERAWITWWAEHPEDKTQLDRYMHEQQAVTAQARRLLENGEAPGSPAAQAVLQAHLELLLRYNVRERQRRLLAWNASTTEKWMSIGMRLRKDNDGERFQAYWADIMRQSPWGRAFRELMLQVREIKRIEPDPASAALDEAVRRLQEICSANGLGDALLLIEWRRFVGRHLGDLARPDESLHPEWDFMEQALRAREVTTPRAA